MVEYTSGSTQSPGTWNNRLADFHSVKLGPHDGPYIEVNGTPRLVNDSAILAADASVAHLAALRVLSIAESREGITHLRVLMKDAPVDVAHVANAVEK